MSKIKISLVKKQMDIVDINIDECRQFIADNYVTKLLKYLRGEAAIVSSNKEFMKVYQVIIYQCDANDNNQQVCDIQDNFV